MMNYVNQNQIKHILKQMECKTQNQWKSKFKRNKIQNLKRNFTKAIQSWAGRRVPCN